MPARVCYIHGFGSSGSSEKALILKEFFAQKGVDFLSPDLPISPLEAVNQLDDYLSKNGITFTIGSSLGGFYSYYFAHRKEIAGIQINPVTRPEIMRPFLGRHPHRQSGLEFEFTERHLLELEEILCSLDEKHDRLLNLFLSTDDKVIEVETALQWYQNANIVQTFNGLGHDFLPLDGALPMIGALVDSFSGERADDSYWDLDKLFTQ